MREKERQDDERGQRGGAGGAEPERPVARQPPARSEEHHAERGQQPRQDAVVRAGQRLRGDDGAERGGAAGSALVNEPMKRQQRERQPRGHQELDVSGVGEHVGAEREGDRGRGWRRTCCR